MIGKHTWLVGNFLLLISQTVLLAENIPATRIAPWPGNVGVEGGIPRRTTVFTNFNPNATTAQINNALRLCPSNQVVKLAAGTYNLGSQALLFTKNGVVLRGAGMTNTVLISTKDGNSYGGCIVIAGGNPLASWPIWKFDHVVKWTNGFAEGATNLRVNNSSGLRVGNVVGLDQIDDGEEVTGKSLEGSDGGRGNNGTSVYANRIQEQWCEVTAIDGNTVTIWPPLRGSKWKLSQTPEMFWMNDVRKMVGIEDLTIDGSFAHPSGPYGANIYLLYSWNCWVKNVKSIKPVESHISFEYGGRSETRHCYFFDTQVQGQKSYGWQPSKASSCLLEDCIFEKVTAAVQVGTGGGHVISYNFMTNILYLPDPGAFHSAIWQHQGYNAYNLFEGNFCNGIDFDEFHGSSGYQTVFRNRLTGKESNYGVGSPLIVWPTNYYVNIVGNVLGTSGQHHHVDGAYGSPNPVQRSDAIYDIGFQYGKVGPDAKVFDTIYRHGNYDVVNDSVVWNSTNPDRSIPNSLCYGSKPVWFGDRPWPPYDPSNPSAAVATSIPAGYRFVFGIDPPGSGPAPPQHLRIANQ